jgi:hypothetical protein
MLPQHQARDLLLRSGFSGFSLVMRATCIFSFLPLSISGSHAPCGHGLFLFCGEPHALALPFFPPGGSGPVMFLLSDGIQVSLGLQENCTLWYFGLTVFCLLSQTLHASIHGVS